MVRVSVLDPIFRGILLSRVNGKCVRLYQWTRKESGEISTKNDVSVTEICVVVSVPAHHRRVVSLLVTSILIEFPVPPPVDFQSCVPVT